MKIGKSDCLGFAILCTMIALKTVFVRHIMGITYEIAGLVPSLLIVGAKIRKFSDIGIKKNLQNFNIVLNKFRRQRNVQRHRASQKSH